MHVRVSLHGARALATRLIADAADEPSADPSPWDLVAEPGRAGLERAVATALVLDTVNFGSGWHPVLRKDPGVSGSTTVARGIRRWLELGGPTVDRLRRCDTAVIAEACGQPLDEPGPRELMELFAAALRELGDLLATHYDGRVLPMVEEARGSAARFASLLAPLPGFADRSTHDGREVALYKRAQLAAADVHRASGGRAPGAFADVDRLTAFADNLVPHVLRLEGVLDVEPELVARIAAGALLPHGSPEEVELRATGVHAVELVCDELARQGAATTPAELDARLWRRGGGARFKAVPRHRTRCRAY